MPTINTERLYMRTYNMSDATTLFDFIQKNKIHLGGYFPTVIALGESLAYCSIFIEEQIKCLETKEKLACGIFDAATETYLGHIFLKGIEWIVPKGEVGYFIDKNWQGKGLMTEALNAFSEYCFEEWKMEKIYLRTTLYNLASQKVAIKAGFEPEGLLRRDFRTAEGDVVDVHYYGKIKNHSPITEL